MESQFFNVKIPLKWAGCPASFRCYIWHLGFCVISLGSFWGSLPGYLNVQWRITWGTTQSKPSTTPRQRMPTIFRRYVTSWGVSGLGSEIVVSLLVLFINMLRCFTSIKTTLNLLPSLHTHHTHFLCFFTETLFPNGTYVVVCM